MSPSQLDPEELRRLLNDATDPIRPGPEAYGQIRDGIARRRIWMPRLAAAGVLAAVAVAGVVYAAVPRQDRTIDATNAGSGASTSTGGSTVSATGTTPRPGESHRTTPTRPGGGTTRAPGTSPSTSAGPTPSTSPSARTSPPVGGATTGPTTAPPLATGAADLDGDGKADTISYSATDQLSVALSKSGLTVQVALPTSATAPTLTATDLDGTGADELLVQTAPGPAAATYRVVAYVGGKLTVLPQVLSAGVSPGQGSGFACADDTVVAQAATSTDGSSYTGTRTTYTYAGGVLTVVGTPAPVTVSLAAGGSGPFTAGCGVKPTS